MKEEGEDKGHEKAEKGGAGGEEPAKKGEEPTKKGEEAEKLGKGWRWPFGLGRVGGHGSLLTKVIDVNMRITGV